MQDMCKASVIGRCTPPAAIIALCAGCVSRDVYCNAGPPMQKGRTKKLLTQAALAGGIASGSTTLMMYPLDTLKTRLQSAAGASVAGVVRSVPSIGLRGLYR